VGGNSIAFARSGCDVVAVELDDARLGLARHNAAVYGVRHKIDFRCGDCLALVPRLGSHDVLFVDPPWGEAWNRTRTTLSDLPLLEGLLDCVRPTSEAPPEGTPFKRLLAKVPPSFDPATVPSAKAEAWFGHETGDRHRVKFILLDIDLAHEL
jgi:predicted RNA methylase